MTLCAGVESADRFSEKGDDAGIYEFRPPLLWLRVRSVGHETSSDPLACLAAPCSPEPQRHDTARDSYPNDALEREPHCSSSTTVSDGAMVGVGFQDPKKFLLYLFLHSKPEAFHPIDDILIKSTRLQRLVKNKVGRVRRPREASLHPRVIYNFRQCRPSGRIRHQHT